MALWLMVTPVCHVLWHTYTGVKYCHLWSMMIQKLSHRSHSVVVLACSVIDVVMAGISGNVCNVNSVSSSSLIVTVLVTLSMD